MLGCLNVLVRDVPLVFWGVKEATQHPDLHSQTGLPLTVCLFFETWSLYVTLAVLALDTLTRLSSNLQRISLPLPVHPGIKGMHYHA